MKKLKILFLAMVLPLSGCSRKLVIPTVDVNKLNISLPTLPTRNVGEIRSDSEFEYLDLYELSDFHGAVYEEKTSSKTYIGLSKLASYFDERREENKGGTLILSSGDMFQGSADSNLTRGYMVNYCMQYMGFDAMSLGNHEFDWTDEWIKKNAELKYNTTSVPYLGANILKDGAIPSFLKKSTVVTRQDYKVGIIGVMGLGLESSIMKTCREGYEFVDYQPIVSAEATRLKSEEGCNAVVLLAHEAADELKHVEGVDAAFGGHAHRDITSAIPGTTVPCLGTRNYGQSVAHISLKFNKADKSLVGSDVAEIKSMSSVVDSLSENSAINNIISQYAPAIDKIKNIKLGKADAELEADKALKNLCVKSMHEAACASASSLGIDSSRIIAAYHNVSGGIRDNIAKGKITYGDVYKPFPFDNEVVMIEVTGQEYVDRIHTLDNLGIYRTFTKRSEINVNEKYYIVLTDFLAFDYFKSFKELTDEDLIRTGKIVRDEVAGKIYSLRKVKNDTWKTNSENYRAVSITF